MMKKCQVLIIGYGEMGHALEYLLEEKHDVRIWSRSGTSNLENEVSRAHVILFCLPVNAHYAITQRILPFLTSGSLCLSIAKGIDDSGRTAPQVFAELLAGDHRYGVVYGPMISEEILLGRYAFADVAMSDFHDFITIRNLFSGSKLVCTQSLDMLGCCWSVILKNVYAIMMGISDELKLGDNMRGYFVVMALSELSAIVALLGSKGTTSYGYAGLGDLITTSTSVNSHHYTLGRKLASGQFSEISGEGVHTLKMVEKYKLFERQNFPLYNLIESIVSHPDTLREGVAAYCLQVQIW
jgi:glycerol-3-phosphate dehydrogenase (NAD(P)+)